MLRERSPRSSAIGAATLVLALASAASGASGAEVEVSAQATTTPEVVASTPAEAERAVRIEIRVQDKGGKRGRPLASPSLTSVLGQEATVMDGMRVPFEGPGGEVAFLECNLRISVLPTALLSDGSPELINLRVTTEWARCWPPRLTKTLQRPLDSRINSTTWSGDVGLGEWATVAAHQWLHIDVAISEP